MLGDVYLDSNQDNIFPIDSDQLIMNYYQIAWGNTNNSIWSRDVNKNGVYINESFYITIGIHLVIVLFKFVVSSEKDERTSSSFSDEINSLAGNDYINTRPGRVR